MRIPLSLLFLFISLLVLILSLFVTVSTKNPELFTLSMTFFWIMLLWNTKSGMVKVYNLTDFKGYSYEQFVQAWQEKKQIQCIQYYFVIPVMQLTAIIAIIYQIYLFF